ncbi:MAG TPA: class I SAM-dependent methyltransferase [Bradyrhizobium sp.]
MKHLREVLSGPVFQLLGYRPQRVSVADWDSEYRGGAWDYLGTIGSIAGQTSILGYCQYLAPETILDVGCGSGVLASKLKILPYKSFLGIDISPEAIARADSVRDARTGFAVAEADDFHTDRTFDAIIFNQCLNYLSDPVATLVLYARLLNPNGRIIVSLFETARSRLIWKLIDSDMRVLDWMRYGQSEGQGTTKVLLRR